MRLRRTSPPEAGKPAVSGFSEESVPDTESGLSPPMVHGEENKLVRANLDGVAVVAATL